MGERVHIHIAIDPPSIAHNITSEPIVVFWFHGHNSSLHQSFLEAKLQVQSSPMIHLKFVHFGGSPSTYPLKIVEWCPCLVSETTEVQ